MKNTTLMIFAFVLALTSCKKEESVMEKDDKTIQDYFADKDITDAIKDPSGVYILHITEGTGESPALNNFVTVKYELYNLPSETRVEQTEDPITFKLSNLIAGWQIGIPYLKKGGAAYLFVPSSYAYGDGKVLRFKITLIDFKTPAEQALAEDKVIQDYFAANNITDVIADTSGVYIQHITEGTGSNPSLSDYITVKYAIYNLPAEKLLKEVKTPVSLNLGKLMTGWQIGIPYMKKGGEAYLYMPSKHAYDDGKVLRFKITLVDF